MQYAIGNTFVHTHKPIATPPPSLLSSSHTYIQISDHNQSTTSYLISYTDLKLVFPVDMLSMAKKKRTALAGRAWSLVRLAFLWARRGGLFKRGFMADLIRKYLKNLQLTAATNRDSIGYAGEREFSFDETPLFHSKLKHKSTGWSSTRFKYLPAISCINPAVDDDDAQDDPRTIFRASFNDIVEDEEISSPRYWEQGEIDGVEESDDNGEEDEEIDAKAEEFIERFYREMRMQRQVSYLEYNEMLKRGAN